MGHNRPFFSLLAWAVLFIAAVPVGTSVFVLGAVLGDSPCVLCWAQRTGMILVALMGLFVLRYGPRPRYLGLSVLLGAWGVYMGIRHSAAHVVRDIGQGFSVELFGAHTYVWSTFVFWCCLAAMGLLLVLLRDGEATRTDRRWNPFERLAGWVFLVVVAANALQAFASTGPPPYMGQSDPVRFSVNPRHWVWSTEEWAPAPISWRGRWAIPKPDPATLAESAPRPPSAAPPLRAVRAGRIGGTLHGPVSDLAFDHASRRFLVTTGHGVYLFDSALSGVERGTVVDPGFSIDLDRVGGAAFLDAQTVIAMARNKSYVILREALEADPARAARNFRFFLASHDAFDEVARGRVATVRARMQYVHAVAYDPAGQSLYTVGIPNATVPRLVVSRFDRRDLTLSEEFVPEIADGLAGALPAGDRPLSTLAVTGLAWDGGRLFAVSAAHRLLLTIDVRLRTITAAHALTDVQVAAGLASTGAELVVAEPDGRVVYLPRPAEAVAAAQR
jgi:disulfide bond formation protein DsbB